MEIATKFCNQYTRRPPKSRGGIHASLIESPDGVKFSGRDKSLPYRVHAKSRGGIHASLNRFPDGVKLG